MARQENPRTQYRETAAGLIAVGLIESRRPSASPITWTLLYLNGMTHRVGAKGQIVIPKDLRERAGLLPGADVEFEIDGQRVSIKAAHKRAELGGRFALSGMAGRLLEDRLRELQ